MVHWEVHIGINNISESEFKKLTPPEVKVYTKGNKKIKIELTKQKSTIFYNNYRNSTGDTLTSLFEDTNLFKEARILKKDSINLDYEIEISKKTAKKLIQTLKKENKEYLESNKIQNVPKRQKTIFKDDCETVISTLENAVGLMKTTITLHWNLDG
tara:strand:- start:70 stop:537 length:468 start_codon:yes stop_codon:yes gene_type:complete